MTFRPDHRLSLDLKQDDLQSRAGTVPSDRLRRCGLNRPEIPAE